MHDTDPKSPLELKQVEFNTIAASFGALSQRAGEMHRYASTYLFLLVPDFSIAGTSLRLHIPTSSCHHISPTCPTSLRTIRSSRLRLVWPKDGERMGRTRLRYCLSSRRERGMCLISDGWSTSCSRRKCRFPSTGSLEQETDHIVAKGSRPSDIPSPNSQISPK